MERLSRFVLENESGRNSPIVKNLLLKKKLLEEDNPDCANIKTALIMGGGGTRGVYGGGVVTGLEKVGLSDAFDLVIGVSSGAADLAYFLAGQSELGTSLWYEDLVDRKFINVARLKRVLDLDYAEYLMRYVKPLNQEKIRSGRSEFLIGVTNTQTGKGEFVVAKDGVDIVTAVIASSALPIAYNRTRNINGVEYGDGAIGNGIPIEKAIEKGCTDILVVLNNEVNEKTNGVTLLERLLVGVYMRKFTPEFRSATLGRHRLHSKTSELIEIHGETVNIGIIAPETMPVSRISKDSKGMKGVARKAQEQVQRLFTA